MWDVTTGACLHVLQGHSEEVYCLAVLADGRTVVSGSWDTTVRIWDVRSGRALTSFTLPAAVSCIRSLAPASPGQLPRICVHCSRGAPNVLELIYPASR